MAKKLISPEKIIEASLVSSFKKGMGATSLSDISDALGIKKASLYNHFASEEEMLNAIYLYCSDYSEKINFFAEEDFSKVNSKNAVQLFSKAASDYVKKHEAEPLFQIYTLVNSEKYFTKECLDIFEKQRAKVETQIFLFLKIIADKNIHTDEFLRKEAGYFISSFLFMMDMYLAKKKETIRQNPECDAGSLFALPTDEKSLALISKFAQGFIQAFVKN